MIKKVRISWIVLALTAAMCAYGFVHGRLWEQRMWSAAGTSRFLAYSGVYWIAAAPLAWLAPRWLVYATTAFAIAYSAWWAGLAAPLAVLYFLGSCWALGRLVTARFALAADALAATLAGAAVWSALLWVALHFPVNTPWVYGVAFALPYAGLRKIALPRGPARPIASRAEALGCAVLLYILIAHGLAALKPEISADGLAMHLALPMTVAQQGLWPFDFQHAAWALIPTGADRLYTAVFMLGGEAAAQLLNVSFLALTSLLIARVAREWVSPAAAWVAAALFASTPLVQLVTASLFVENVWAAFVLASALALHREDVKLGALFAGAATMVKLIAAAFAIPLLLWAAWIAYRQRAPRAALAGAVLFIAFAAPTYVYAWAVSGNPVFPFANAIFQSDAYPSERSFTDARFDHLRIAPRTPYDLTFHSSRYIEGQEGAGGFQYLLLLPAALILIRKRDQVALALTALAGGAIVLTGAPNLRYLYAAMPLATIALSWLGPRVLVASAAALIPLNLWFLPASGWYNQDFALFREAGAEAYTAKWAPTRVLIDRLNREAPGAPVAFFGTDTTAGLLGESYTGTWHHERYWESVRNAPTDAAIAARLRALGIVHVVAPATREAPFEVVQKFLEKWLDPDGPPVGTMALYRLRSEAILPVRDPRPLTRGVHDDLEPRIEYTGAWLHDPQWAEAVEHSLTYSNQPGDSLRLTFNGSAIAYIYTQAANRGTAEVRIDGRLRRRVDLRSAETLWRQRARFGNLSPGDHTFEIRVAAGGFVDLDAIEVE